MFGKYKALTLYTHNSIKTKQDIELLKERYLITSDIIIKGEVYSRRLSSWRSKYLNSIATKNELVINIQTHHFTSCVCRCVCVYVSAVSAGSHTVQKRESGATSTWTIGCELLDVGIGTWTWAFCTICKRSTVLLTTEPSLYILLIHFIYRMWKRRILIVSFARFRF